jgi:hypothetical protein
VATAGAGTNSALLSVEVRQLGGELGRARPQSGAQPSIDALFALYAVGVAPVPEAELIVGTQVGELLSAMSPWTASHVDPGDRIRSNHPVGA